MPNIINSREIFPLSVKLLRNFLLLIILSPLGFPRCAVAVGYVMVTVVWGTASRRVWNTPHTTMLRINNLHNNSCGKNQHPAQQQLR